MFPAAPVRPLTVEEISSTGESFKDDLQREANRCVRQHNAVRALSVLEAIEYIDKFVFTLKMAAGSRLGMPQRARPIRLPQRIR